jgi:hypothetical protein
MSCLKSSSAGHKNQDNFRDHFSDNILGAMTQITDVTSVSSRGKNRPPCFSPGWGHGYSHFAALPSYLATKCQLLPFPTGYSLGSLAYFSGFPTTSGFTLPSPVWDWASSF